MLININRYFLLKIAHKKILRGKLFLPRFRLKKNRIIFLLISNHFSYTGNITSVKKFPGNFPLPICRRKVSPKWNSPMENLSCGKSPPTTTISTRQLQLLWIFNLVYFTGISSNVKLNWQRESMPNQNNSDKFLRI